MEIYSIDEVSKMLAGFDFTDAVTIVDVVLYSHDRCGVIPCTINIHDVSSRGINPEKWGEED